MSIHEIEYVAIGDQNKVYVTVGCENRNPIS